MSDYRRNAALAAFTDLVSHIKSRYLVVSYNNTYHSKSSSSENKIKLEQLEEVLNKCGNTQVFNHEFKAFNSGKTLWTMLSRIPNSGYTHRKTRKKLTTN